MFSRKSALLLWAFFVGAEACSDPTTESKQAGRHLVDKIVFANSGTLSTAAAIYSIGTDGSGLSILQSGSGGGCRTLSPDGTAIVFIATNGSIATMKIDTTGYYEVGTQVKEAGRSWVCPQWSSDSKRIAFIRFKPSTKAPGESELYSVNADGTELKTLAKGDTFLDIGWSPAGDHLLLSTTRHTDGGNYDYATYLVNADGTGSIRVSQSITGIAWAPDAKRIALACGNDRSNLGYGRICVTNPDGSGAIAVTDSATQGTNPVWSFDGAHIAFICNLRICIVNPDGTGLKIATTRIVVENHVIWSPNSKQLAYTCRPQPIGPETVCVVNADGTNDRVLTTLNGDNGSLSWSPSR